MKINITIEDNVDIKTALLCVEHVISLGKISNNNTQYCYATTWTDGTYVLADKTKRGNSTFRVGRKRR